MVVADGICIAAGCEHGYGVAKNALGGADFTYALLRQAAEIVVAAGCSADRPSRRFPQRNDSLVVALRLALTTNHRARDQLHLCWGATLLVCRLQ